jgi:hypothetical protein
MNKIILKRGIENIESQIFRLYSPIDFDKFYRFVDDFNLVYYSVKTNLTKNPDICLLNRNIKSNSGILILKVIYK